MASSLAFASPAAFAAAELAKSAELFAPAAALDARESSPDLAASLAAAADLAASSAADFARSAALLIAGSSGYFVAAEPA